MYKKNKILIVISVLLLLSACKKNFLDRTPESNISNAEFWKTSNDLRLYANNWYSNYLPALTDWAIIGIYGLDADNGSDNMQHLQYNAGLNGEVTVPASGGEWDWSMLRNVNYFLVNYNKSTDPAAIVNPYVGEALFFRSLFYYNMVRKFGDLPWIDKPLDPNDENLTAPRLSRNVIVTNILNDLNTAINYLPSKSKATPSRINKQIAQLLASRIALFEGTWEKYHKGTVFGVTGADGTEFLQKAASISNDLIANPDGYAIENFSPTDNMAYWNLFNRVSYTSSTEVMFWRQYDLSKGIGHHWANYTNGGASRGLTKDLVDAYLCKDGKPISLSPLYQGDNTLLNVVANRDPRLNQTMYVNDGNHILNNNRGAGLADLIFQAPTLVGSTESLCSTGYQTYKGHIPDANQRVSLSTTGLIYFRFAEALLINAESKAELGTLTQADIDKTVNPLRRRVGMPDMVIANLNADPLAEFPSLSTLINEVRRERRVEFACEGYRRDDLQRWAAMDEKIVGKRLKGAKLAQWVGLFTPSDLSKYPVDANGYIDYSSTAPALANGYKFRVDRDYLLPIPQNQLLLNKNIKQNPGW